MNGRWSAAVLIAMVVAGAPSGCKTGSDPAGEDPRTAPRHRGTRARPQARARRAPPRSPGEAAFGRGLAALRAKTPNFAAALAAFQEAARTTPARGPVQANIGYCLLHLGRLEAARRAYARAVERSPTSRKAILGLAEVLLRAGKAAKAVERIAAYLRQKPRDTRALAFAAAAYRADGKPDLALARIQQALSVDPKNPDAYYQFGLLYLDKKDTQTALMILNRGLKLRANHPDLTFARGLAWLRHQSEDTTGHIGRAVIDFETTIRRAPGHVAARLNLGKIYLDNLDFRGALAHYQGVLDRWPTHREGLLGKARSLFGLRKFKEAAGLYALVLKQHPNEARAVFQLGKLHQDHLEQPKQALVYFERFVQLSPGLAQTDKVFETIKMLRAMIKATQSARPRPRPPAKGP